MARFPVIIDIETKNTFKEKRRPQELGISVLGIYDYASQNAWTVREDKINEIFPVLEKASYIIGYNVIKFDLQVLQAYYPGDVSSFSAFDLMEDIKAKIGRRISLDELVFATLGERKIGHGLKAVEDYKKGNWEELEKYCLKDVLLTKKLFEFGVRNGKIYFLDEKGKQEIKVDWRRILEGDSDSNISLTLPF